MPVRAHAGLPADRIKPETKFGEIGLDFLDMVRLVQWIEQEFDVQLPDDDSAKVKNVSALAKMVVAHKTDVNAKVRASIVHEFVLSGLPNINSEIRSKSSSV